MLKWFVGGAIVFGGGTYLAHLYCQPQLSMAILTPLLSPAAWTVSAHTARLLLPL